MGSAASAAKGTQIRDRARAHPGALRERECWRSFTLTPYGEFTVSRRRGFPRSARLYECAHQAGALLLQRVHARRRRAPAALAAQQVIELRDPVLQAHDGRARTNVHEGWLARQTREPALLLDRAGAALIGGGRQLTFGQYTGRAVGTRWLRREGDQAQEHGADGHGDDGRGEQARAVAGLARCPVAFEGAPLKFMVTVGLLRHFRKSAQQSAQTRLGL